MPIFITLEGIDGSGKTTVSKIIKGSLGREGYRILLIKEPTDTLLGEFIRSEILGAHKKNISFMKHLDGKTFTMAALFLFSADRTVHINEIKAESNDFDIIICDRFIDSTYAYQAAGLSNTDEDRELKDFILSVNEFILKQKNFAIDRTYLFDLNPEAALKRLNGRAHKLDCFDSRPPDFFDSVRNNYLYLSEIYNGRIKTIDVSGSPESVAAYIADDIKELAKNRTGCNQK